MSEEFYTLDHNGQQIEDEEMSKTMFNLMELRPHSSVVYTYDLQDRKTSETYMTRISDIVLRKASGIYGMVVGRNREKTELFMISSRLYSTFYSCTVKRSSSMTRRTDLSETTGSTLSLFVNTPP